MNIYSTDIYEESSLGNRVLFFLWLKNIFRFSILKLIYFDFCNSNTSYFKLIKFYMNSKPSI